MKRHVDCVYKLIAMQMFKKTSRYVTRFAWATAAVHTCYEFYGTCVGGVGWLIETC